MRKIKEPIINQEEICNSFVELKYKERIIEKSIKYKEIISNVESLVNDESKFQSLNEDYNDYMIKMYSKNFSNKNYKNIYKFYQIIRNGEKYCPYCNVPTREVKQVDHYLPKSKFPALAIVAKNLVPICKECNELKGNYFSLENENQLIHPYYDIEMLDAFEYIECVITENINIGFRFSIKKLDRWSNTFYKRVIFHFKKLKIDELYLSDFVTEYSIYIEELNQLYQEEGIKEEIKKAIERKVKSYYNKKIMPWRYAGYKCLLESEWFFKTFFS